MGSEYEPEDSRNVTGTSTNQTGDRWSQQAQQGQTPNAAGQPGSASQPGSTNPNQGGAPVSEADNGQQSAGQYGGGQAGAGGQVAGGSGQMDQSGQGAGTGDYAETGQGGTANMAANQQESGQQAGGSSDMSGQAQQFDNSASERAGDGESGFASQIREHMEVIGADGSHVGTVDKVEGDRIKLTKKDSGAGFGGEHDGHHHYLSLSQVADIEGDQVRLSASGATAYGMEAEE